MVVCCLFVLFVATLSEFGLLFFEIEALIELRKMLLRNTLFDVQLGNCSTPKILIFCRFTGFTSGLFKKQKEGPRVALTDENRHINKDGRVFLYRS